MLYLQKKVMAVKRHVKWLIERKIAKFLLKLIGLLIFTAIVALLALSQNSI